MVTPVPFALLLLVAALVLLLWEDAAAGAAQVLKCAPGAGRAVWGVASALASHTAEPG